MINVFNPAKTREAIKCNEAMNGTAVALTNELSWTKLGYLTNISAGQYQFTDTNAPANPSQFYRVRDPARKSTESPKEWASSARC